jgi:hypothetical protein
MSILPLSLARFACYMMAHGAEIQNGRKGKVVYSFARREGPRVRKQSIGLTLNLLTKKLTLARELESYECQHFNVTSQVQWLRRGSS